MVPLFGAVGRRRLWNRGTMIMQLTWNSATSSKSESIQFNNHEIRRKISQAMHGSNSMNRTWIGCWDSWEAEPKTEYSKRDVTDKNRTNCHFESEHFESDRSHEDHRFRKSNSIVAHLYRHWLGQATRMHKKNHAYHATMKQKQNAMHHSVADHHDDQNSWNHNNGWICAEFAARLLFKLRSKFKIQILSCCRYVSVVDSRCSGVNSGQYLSPVAAQTSRRKVATIPPQWAHRARTRNWERREGHWMQRWKKRERKKSWRGMWKRNKRS